MEYLYHYTNIESLALILKNHTIRFSSLDQMDDKQENMASDISSVGQFCYISSWTSDSTESIPMWNMYSSLNSGARIKLRKNPFKVFTYSKEDLKKFFRQTNYNLDMTDCTLSLYHPIEELFSSYKTPRSFLGAELYAVEYTNKHELLYPQTVITNADTTNIAIGALGKYKNLHWEFQNEWRYRWIFLPLNLTFDSPEQEFATLMTSIISESATQPFKHYDNQISDEAYAEMEITLSPSISLGNKELIMNTIQKYNPTAIIKESELTGLI